MHVTGVVLAGGESRRMGTDKAFVEIDGRTMAELVTAVLGVVCDEVLVAGRSDPPTSVEVIPDPPSMPRGPLAGLVAGIRRAGEGVVFLAAVDQPWLRSETVTRLLDMVEDLPVVPVVEGTRQTTCAVYPVSTGTAASEELAAGGSLQSLLDRAAFRPVVESEWKSWGEDGRSWFSVDTIEDLNEGLKRYGLPQPRI